jgi:acyl-coenzyme A thioesterase PaaI-like protein
MPAGSSVLSVEYKINLLAPADGERLVASGQVVRSGRTITVCDLEVLVDKVGVRTLCARGMQTLMCLDRGPRGAAPG